MGFTTSNTLPLLLLLSFLLFGIIAGTGALAYRAHNYHSRSCIIAATFMASQIIGLVIILSDSLLSKNISSQFTELLIPYHLIIAYLSLFPLLAYIVEMKRPNWLNHKRCILLISPMAIVSSLLLFVPESHTKLYSLQDIYFNGDKTDVLLRIILGLLFIIYGTSSVLVKYEQKKTGLPKLVADINQILVTIAPFTFLLGLNLNIYPVAVFQAFLLVTIDIFIIYTELVVRIPANVDAIPEKPKTQKRPHPYFDNPKYWMDPDIYAADLAREMGTNQKYLSEQIKACGYSGFSDMINHKRVEYICEKLSSGKSAHADIIQLMYDAGFRSRSTASSEFKRIVGCTPSEYQKKLG